jgi:hypothetical protein
MTDENKPQGPEEKHGSDVARLLQLISLEYQSAQQGLYGLAAGTSKHDFITARVEAMERMRQRVIDLVGDEDKANKMVIDQLDKAAKGETKKDEGQQ